MQAKVQVNKFGAKASAVRKGEEYIHSSLYPLFLWRGLRLQQS